MYPIWSSDGQHVAFQSDREGDLGIFWQRADGTGTAERLTTADKETGHLPESWLPRGDGFLFRVSKGAVNTLSFYSLRDKKDTPFAGVQSATPTNAVFSPNGRWFTYETSGTVNSQRAVYVQPFPATGATYQLPVVEQGGYRHPLWSPDGKELFYVIGGGSVRRRVAGVVTQPAFTFGNPSPLPGVWRDSATDVTRQYQHPAGRPAVHRDHSRRLCRQGDRHPWADTADSRCVELARRAEAARPGAIARLWAPGRLARRGTPSPSRTPGTGTPRPERIRIP